MKKRLVIFMIFVGAVFVSCDKSNKNITAIFDKCSTVQDDKSKFKELRKSATELINSTDNNSYYNFYGQLFYGLSYFNNNEFEKCIKYLEENLKEDTEYEIINGKKEMLTARSYQYLKNYEQAINNFKKAVETPTIEKNREEDFLDLFKNCTQQMMYCYLFSNKYNEGIQYLKELYQKDLPINSIANRYILTNMIYLMSTSNTEELPKYIEEFETYPENSNNFDRYVEYLFLSNATYRYDKQKCIDYALKSYDAIQKSEEKTGINYLFNIISGCYSELGEIEKAIEFNNQAYENFRKANDKNGLYAISLELAKFYMMYSDYNMSNRYMNIAYDYALELNNKSFQSTTLHNKLNFDILEEKTDSLKRTVDSLIAISNDELKNIVLGKYYSQIIGKSSEAIKLLDNYINNSETSKDEKIISTILKAQAYANEKNIVLANNTLKEAEQQIDKTYSIANSKLYLKKILSVYKQIGNNKGIIQTYDNLSEIVLSLKEIQKQTAINDLDKKYKTDTKNLIIENQLNIIKRDRIIIIFSTISLLLFIMFLAITLRKNKRIKILLNRLYLNQQEIISNKKLIQHLNEKLSEDTPETSEDKNKKIAIKIIESFEKEQIYTDPEISLDKMAKIIGTNTKYISNIINQHFECNFKTLINNYRIEYCCSLLNNKKYDSISINEIATMCGFSSTSSFYSVFKDKTGMSPIQYRKTKNKL